MLEIEYSQLYLARSIWNIDQMAWVVEGSHIMVRKLLCRLFLAGSTGLVASHSSAAVILTSYGFEAGTLAPTTVATGVSASNILISGHTLGTVGVNAVGVYFVDTASTGNLATYFPNTVDANNEEAEVAGQNYYFSITVSPSGSDPIRLSSIGLDINAGASSNGRNFFIRYDHTGESPANNYAGPNIGGSTVTSTSFTSRGPYSLTGLEDILPGESVTFRFFGYRTTNSNSAQNLRYDNIVILGDVIPEPATAGLLGSCAVALLLRRRRTH